MLPIDEQYEEVARKIFYDCARSYCLYDSDQKMYDIPGYEEALANRSTTDRSGYN